MPLLPEIAAIVDAAADPGRPAISAGTPGDARRLVAAMLPALGAGPDLPRVETVAIPTRGGSIPGRLFTPEPPARGLLVFFHGGGWLLGSLDDYDATARVLAARGGCSVLLPDYRLAPEHPFPAAIEDALDTVLWAAAQYPAAPLVLGGDSAGGNLAAIAAAELHQVVPVAAQVLIYPVTDGDLDTPSYHAHGGPGLLSRADMAWFIAHYAPGVARTDPLLYPAARPDLAGLPPAHVVTAEIDVLRDEGEAYAHRLQAAGVPTTLHRAPGMPHGFIRLHNLVPAADAELAAIASAAAQAIAQARGSRVAAA